MAFEIRKPVTCNLKPPREKRVKEKSPAEKRAGNAPEYLALVRQLPCCVCGKPGPSEAHHLRATGRRGGAMRSPDRDALPLCASHHRDGVHRVGGKRELAWFKERGIDPLTLADALHFNKHSLDAMSRVLMTHREA